MEFLDLLWPDGFGTVALVGGGGKTSVMAQVSREAAFRGVSVLMTVTTRLQNPCPVEADRLHAAGGSGEPRPRSGERVLWVGESVADGRKWGSPDITAVEELAVRPGFRMLVEADGSAGRPVKAPGEGEPVIPSGTDTVAAVVGLSALGRPIGEPLIHRLEPFLAVTGARTGEPFGPEHLSRLIAHPGGSFKGCPGRARRVVILNQADAVDRDAAAGIAEGLRRLGIGGITLAVSAIGRKPPIRSIVEL